MEFLMTYGWAVLILLVVVSVLFYIGVLNPQASAVSSCVFPTGFTCSETRLDDGGNLYLDLGQATGRVITVTGIGCGTSSNPAVWPASVVIRNGAHAVITGGGIPCAGAEAPAFKGRVVVQYTMAGSGLPRSVVGDISAPVTGGTSYLAGGPRWNSSFSFVRPVILNTGVASNLADFPAYFVFDSASLIAAGKMNSTCKDARLVTYDNQTMAFEIEANTCNTTSTVIWLRLPQTSANRNYFAYLYYGNSSVADGQNKPGVWSNGYVAVYHLSDCNDSAGSNTGTPNGVACTAGGRIGGAYAYDSASDYIRVPDSASLNTVFGTESFTLEAWVYPLDYINYRGILNKRTSSYHSASPGGLFSDIGGLKVILGTGNDNETSQQIMNVAPLNAWHHIVGMANATHLSFYVDGTSRGSQAITLNPPVNGEPLAIGAFYPGQRGFSGTIDEVRIANVPRTLDWIVAENGQTYSVGSEQANG